MMLAAALSGFVFGVLVATLWHEKPRRRRQHLDVPVGVSVRVE